MSVGLDMCEEDLVIELDDEMVRSFQSTGGGDIVVVVAGDATDKSLERRFVVCTLRPAF